jgi:hypothetical protein
MFFVFSKNMLFSKTKKPSTCPFLKEDTFGFGHKKSLPYGPP